MHFLISFSDRFIKHNDRRQSELFEDKWKFPEKDPDIEDFVHSAEEIRFFLNLIYLMAANSGPIFPVRTAEAFARTFTLDIEVTCKTVERNVIFTAFN